MIKMLQYKMYPAGELRCPTTALVSFSKGALCANRKLQKLFSLAEILQGIFHPLKMFERYKLNHVFELCQAEKCLRTSAKCADLHHPTHAQSHPGINFALH